jgi:glycerol-3-phosphate acyltransferase PlsX
MSGPIVLSIDVMGGDHAPGAALEGVALAAERHRDIWFLLHGQPAALAKLAPGLARRAELRPCEGVVGMDVKPSQALRQGKGTSMWNALVSVETGEAQAAVSAGNTGALMAMAKLRLRPMAGVHRPALAAGWPTMTGVCTVLDVGANVEADAEQLVEFAIMGEAFHRAVRGVARPKVGFLNIGSEDQKGHEEIREAARLFREAQFDIDFQGFVEGDDIAKGVADVVVTDGFTGNVALKTAEGTARMVGHFLKQSLTSGPLAMAGAAIASPALKKLREKMDPGRVNGAVFLGLNGVAVKSHGGTDGPGYSSAVDVAVRMAKSHFRDEIEANLKLLAATEARLAAAGAQPS